MADSVHVWSPDAGVIQLEQEDGSVGDPAVVLYVKDKAACWDLIAALTLLLDDPDWDFEVPGCAMLTEDIA